MSDQQKRQNNALWKPICNPNLTEGKGDRVIVGFAIPAHEPYSVFSKRMAAAVVHAHGRRVKRARVIRGVRAESARWRRE